MKNRVSILGIPFDNISPNEAVERVYAMRLEERAHRVVTPNSEMVYLAQSDPAFAKILRESDFVVPDGVGVIYASKLIGTPIREKVAGIDLGEGLIARMAQTGEGVFFLGAKPGVAELAAQKLCEKYPGLHVAGTQDGYFKNTDEVIDKINQSGAVLLFVCLGVPKQEQFMAEYGDRFTSVRIMLGLGGSLDGYAGLAKRAPKWMIHMGLEWFYRLCKEPYRYKRMLALPKFMLCVLKYGKKEVAKK